MTIICIKTDKICQQRKEITTDYFLNDLLSIS